MTYLQLLAQAPAGQQDGQTTSIVAEPVGKQEQTTTVVQEDSGARGQEVPARRPQQPGIPWILIIAMFVMLYFVMFRGPRKKQQEQNKLVKSLKKNDRIKTIGGIIGTVVEVKDNEIVLKIDESTNTKIKIAVGAVSQKIGGDKS